MARPEAPNRRTRTCRKRLSPTPTLEAPPATDAIIRAEKIEKYYAQPSQNRIQVISATDLSIVPGEILALLGPSGSGKSTMLRMLTGLSTPSAGQVYWHGKPIAEAEINVSIVFQSFALFPWLTVLENVEAPLQARGVAPAERRERSMKMLDTVGLDGFEAAYPKELSGGMRQRVGFARALVVEPEVLFMDEPFSALDVLTAENLRSELLELWAKKTMPTKAVFLVTHNIEEAVLLADRIIVLGRNPGHIRTDFPVQLPQPRDRKSEAFTQLVDYIYKVLTRPDVAPAEAPGQQAEPACARPAPDALPDAAPRAARRHGRPARIAARQGRARRHLPPGRRPGLRDRRSAAHCGRRAVAGLPQNRRRRRGHHPQRRRSLPTPRFCARRSSSATPRSSNVLLLRQIRRALEAKSDHTVPEDFFLDMLDEQFSEEESLRQMETAVTWGRYAELFDFDAARRRFVLPDAQEEEIADRRGRQVKTPAPSRAIAGHRSHLAVLHRSGRGGLRAGALFRHRQHGRLLVPEADPRGADFALHRRAAALRVLLHCAHGHRLPAQPGLRHHLRLHRRLQPAHRAVDGRGPRHSAVHSRAQLSASRGAGHGCAHSRPSAGH